MHPKTAKKAVDAGANRIKTNILMGNEIPMLKKRIHSPIFSVNPLFDEGLRVGVI